MKKYTLIILLTAFVLFGLSAVKTKPLTISNTVSLSPEATVLRTTIVIDFEKEQKTFQVEAKTAYEALVEATKQANVPLETKQYDFGILVQKIGEYENTPERAWIYFVNGAGGDVAADQKVLNPGDRVEWKYIKPN